MLEFERYVSVWGKLLEIVDDVDDVVIRVKRPGSVDDEMSPDRDAPQLGPQLALVDERSVLVESHEIEVFLVHHRDGVVMIGADHEQQAESDADQHTLQEVSEDNG